MRREVYSGTLKLYGEEHERTLTNATNYVSSLIRLERFEEAKSVLHKSMPLARRVLGNSNEITLSMKYYHARALCEDPAATLDDLREAVEILESVAAVWKRVFGNAHPDTPRIQGLLAAARKALAANAAASSSGELSGAT